MDIMILYKQYILGVKVPYILILTLILSWIMITSIIHFAHQLHLIDIPNDRSAHVYTIPVGAGIGFIVAMLIGIVSYDINLILDEWYVFVAISIVLLVGMFDDIFGVKPWVKIVVISVAITLLWWNGISIDSLGVYFGYDITLGLLALPVTVFALVGFTNAFNLIDGIDGLAGMISILVIANFGYIGYRQVDAMMIALSWFTIVALIPFIWYNYNPAKIFMGDSGSLTLGFIVAILSILSLKYVHPIAALYFTALPLYDTFTVIFRRLRKGVSIFKPDQTHIHHLLLKYIGDRDNEGNQTGTRRTVWILVISQFFFSWIGLVVNHMLCINYEIALPALLIFIFGMFIVYYFSTKIERLDTK